MMRTFLLLLLASVGSAAVVSAADDARAVYERERAACLSGRSAQDQATCLREAAAAYHEAQGAGRRPALPPPGYADNAVLRCQALPPAERAECEARVRRGATSGSVAGGGVLRELRTVQPAASAASAASAPEPALPEAASAPR